MSIHIVWKVHNFPAICYISKSLRKCDKKSMFKFLVLNPSANTDDIIRKANSQHLKNGFELILLVKPIGSSANKLDVMTYYPKTEGVSDAHNLVSVDGVIKLSSGITLGLFNGNTSEYEGKIDIIIIPKWPSKLSNKYNGDKISVDFSLDQLVTKHKPRYVFSQGDFFEYGPFEFEDGTCCRFVSLHTEGEGKWFYAFNFPLVPKDVSKNDLVENPFLDNKRKLEDAGDVAEKRTKVVTPKDCFFCLSNPKVETHMIITIGTSVYLTVAKGPLSRSNAEIPFSGHGIIIPVDHVSLTNDSIEKEMNEYESKIATKFEESYPDLTLITFDLNLKKNVHYHKQFLPIHKRFLEDNNFENVLYEKSSINNEKYKKNHTLNFEKVDEIDLEKQFIRFQVYNKGKPETYVCVIEDNNKIVDLQFPRRVLSYIIRSPKRLYWDKCLQLKFKETQDCEEFKKFLA